MSTQRLVDPSRLCIYCGDATRGVRRGEHIVPEALGCTRTFRRVCSKCNNQTLSELDKELVSNTPLRIVAWEELSSNPQDIWDYDRERDVVLEAHAVPGYLHPVLWPQLVLDADRPMFHVDFAEVREVGPKRYLARFH